MDQHAEQLRRILFEADFQLGLNVVNASQRKIIGERAVAGNIQASADSLDHKLVHVDDLGKVRSCSLEALHELGIADQFFRPFDRSQLALDVGEDAANFRVICSSSSMCCSTCRCPARFWTLMSWTLRFF